MNDITPPSVESITRRDIEQQLLETRQAMVEVRSADEARDVAAEWRAQEWYAEGWRCEETRSGTMGRVYQLNVYKGRFYVNVWMVDADNPFPYPANSTRTVFE
jgi:hypothetical protein